MAESKERERDLLSLHPSASQEYSSLESIETRERIHPNGNFFKRHKDGA